MSKNDAKKTKKGSWRWPLIVVGLLSAHVVGMVSAVVYINRNSRELGVVPDYYEKAVHWDQHQAELRASAELGWQVKVEPSPEVDGKGMREVKLALVDKDGKPVGGASMEIKCFHHAHADDVARASLVEAKDGAFETRLAMPYEGFYSFHVRAKAGEKKFLAEMTQYVANDVALGGQAEAR